MAVIIVVRYKVPPPQLSTHPPLSLSLSSSLPPLSLFLPLFLFLILCPNYIPLFYHEAYLALLSVRSSTVPPCH